MAQTNASESRILEKWVKVMHNSYQCDVCGDTYVTNERELELFTLCSKCPYPKCHNYERCGNEACSKVDTIYNKMIFLCVDCDEEYTICNICGRYGLPKEMRRINAQDVFPTCSYCEEVLNEQV